MCEAPGCDLTAVRVALVQCAHGHERDVPVCRVHLVKLARNKACCSVCAAGDRHDVPAVLLDTTALPAMSVRP